MMKVRCVICDRELPGGSRTDSPFFPFCSERCRLIDLGRWLSGSYYITAEGREETSVTGCDDLEHP
jgi:endogenous inhibitor of DNA gyrase (YacG/DUF329 family)